MQLSCVAQYARQIKQAFALIFCDGIIAPNPRLLYLLKYFLPGFAVFNPIKTFKEKLAGTSMTSKISQSRDELIRLVPVSYFEFVEI